MIAKFFMDMIPKGLRIFLNYVWKKKAVNGKKIVNGEW